MAPTRTEPRTRLTLALTTLLAVGLAVGCSRASVRVELDNLAPSARTSTVAPEAGVRPTVFGMKLVSIYMVEDIAADLSNAGAVSTLWQHPACAGSWECGVDPEAAHVVDDYFDFARPSVAVNRDLNAQETTITPGTYRHVRFDFSGPGDTATANMRFGDADQVTIDRFRNDLNSVAIDPPLTILDGETVVLSIAYDLDHSYFPGEQDPGVPPDGGEQQRWYCPQTEPGAHTVESCFYFDLFRPAFAQRPGAPAE